MLLYFLKYRYVAHLFIFIYYICCVIIRIRNEVKILKTMNHKNIIKLEEVFEDRERLFIITELCQGGELFDRIVERTRYTELDACETMRQLFEAVDYMHQQNICHFDLKPENLLFVDTSPTSPLKIIDFGFAQVR